MSNILKYIAHKRMCTNSPNHNKIPPRGLAAKIPKSFPTGGKDVEQTELFGLHNGNTKQDKYIGREDGILFKM